MNRRDLVPGAHVRCIGMPYFNGSPPESRAFTQYLTKLNGKTFGLAENHQAIIIGREGDRLFLLTNHIRWGCHFGWCNTIEAFEVIR